MRSVTRQLPNVKSSAPQRGPGEAQLEGSKKASVAGKKNPYDHVAHASIEFIFFQIAYLSINRNHFQRQQGLVRLISVVGTQLSAQNLRSVCIL